MTFRNSKRPVFAVAARQLAIDSSVFHEALHALGLGLDESVLSILRRAGISVDASAPSPIGSHQIGIKQRMQLPRTSNSSGSRSFAPATGKHVQIMMFAGAEPWGNMHLQPHETAKDCIRKIRSQREVWPPNIMLELVLLPSGRRLTAGDLLTKLPSGEKITLFQWLAT